MNSKKTGLLIVISGPAGSGKGTVIDELLKGRENFAYSVSATSRPKLKDEQDGVHYHYLSRDEFAAAIERGEMLEYTEYCDNFYGTPLKEALKTLESGKHLILEIEVDGAMQIKQKFPDALLIMILPPGHKKQEKRLRERGRDSEEQIIKRLSAAKNEIAHLAEYDYVLINEDDKISHAADDIAAIVYAETLSAKRNLHLKEMFFK